MFQQATQTSSSRSKIKQRRLTEPTEVPRTAHANITHSAVLDVVLTDLLPFTVYTDIDREQKMSEFSLRVGRRPNRCLVERLWKKCSDKCPLPLPV